MSIKENNHLINIEEGLIMSFNYCNTTKLHFTKCLDDISNFMQMSGYHRVLIITGGNNTCRIATRIFNELTDFYCELLSGVSTNPPSEIVEAMTKKAKEFFPDVIITVGGGSVHDVGKAVAVMFYSEGYSVEDYTVNGKLSVPGITRALPVITMPTLYGSGAEVSPAALIRIGNEKRVIFSPYLHPVATFVNTDFTLSLSNYQIARSAFDSLIQAIEGFISTLSNNISNAFARTTIEHFSYCFQFIIDGNIDNDVLEKLSVASIFSSYVCSTASVGAIHAISDPISGRYNIHHATALAMVAIRVLRKNLSSINKEKVAALGNMLDCVDSFKVNPQERVLEKIECIITKFKLLDLIEAIQISHYELVTMAKESYNPDMAGNPYEFTEEEVIEMLRTYFYD